MLEPIAHLGLIEDAEIELDRAALEIAALDHPEADLFRYLSLLDDIAESLRAGKDGARTPLQQAARLAEVLAEGFGFEGDRATYDDPANADLMRVLDRRRGLPIALSILYVAQARRLGWTAHALNTPSHVLVAVGASRSAVIDPFNRGAPVSQGQLLNFLRSALGAGASVSARHVAPMSNRATLVRLLMNQVTRAEQAGEAQRALALMQRITIFAPDQTQAWWSRARLEREAGDTGAARESLMAMLETTRDPALRAQAQRAIDTLTPDV
jgi:regulator of sirC expression with transglutaminase-like and TPR domain